MWLEPTGEVILGRSIRLSSAIKQGGIMKTQFVKRDDIIYGDTVKMYMYFSTLELKCKCCGLVKMDDDFMYDLQEARVMAKTPFKITSGYRCEAHNMAVGGSDTSSHLLGLAVDIASGESSRQRYMIISSLMAVGLSRIGIGKDFIHVDGDKGKNQKLIWLY